MARRTDIDWEAIRKAFEAGEVNVSELARRYNVKRDTVTNRIRKAGWVATAVEVEQIRKDVRDNVVEAALRFKRAPSKQSGSNRAQSGSEPGNESGSAKIDSIAEKIVDGLAAHVEASNDMVAVARIAQRELADIMAALPEHFSRIPMPKDPTKAVSIVMGRARILRSLVETGAKAEQMLSGAVKTSRLVNGIEDGRPSAGAQGEEDATKVDQAVLVVRERAQAAS